MLKSIYQIITGGAFILLWGQMSFAAVLNLASGSAQTLHSQSIIDTAFVSDPSIADYRVLDAHRVVVFGKKIGETAFILYDKQGKTLLNEQIIVNKSMTAIEQKIAIYYPKLHINVSNIGEQVVLSGNVPDLKTRDDIYQLVGTLLKKKADKQKSIYLQNSNSSSSSSSQSGNLSANSNQKYPLDYLSQEHYSGIIDNLTVSGVKQVNVKLSVAEVSTAYIAQLGVKWGSMVDDTFKGNGQFFNYINHVSASNIATFISALNNDSVGQILAEPNLSVISGETASFLVGGELPIVTAYDNSYQVTYKEYGVKLNLAAKVMSDHNIRLTLSPEVSTEDTEYQSTLLDIPSFKTRKATTTVELGDGQSFVLGGLLSKEEEESLQKVPFIGDIPILGALFRYTETTRRNTELIIVATVNLVHPVSPTDIKLPMMQRTSILNRWFGVRPNVNGNTDSQTNALLSQGGFKQ
ncbi:MAG: Type 3 secretion system secretin [Candidatus Celerinatantimonas neptuna]|nr:MAG: Type 3 secretion system secretin [Candidatus Celerinatantimonas neptuna]